MNDRMKPLFATLRVFATLCLWTPFVALAQLLAPEEFLGYTLGERFTPYHRVHQYMEHVATNSEQVQLVTYGESYEGRPLVALFVSSAANIKKLEAIRMSNMQRTGLEAGTPTEAIPIIWMSYNVHGNEAVASETAMKTLWALIDPQNRETNAYLENTVVVIDPCLNPDGQERYVNWYNQKAHLRLQPDPQSVEHIEPWPGGRPNHYLYDLNRDWAWQVQQESRQRAALYNRWMPQVHVDFHEQGINAPYFFAPAAEPVHEFVSPFQREFQEIVGRNNAKYFDANAWMYFTREVFDLFYPSYGDTWPTFNGAIGMTYEQAGSGRAGLGIETALGDTLTLTERILHHHTAGLATIEMVAQHGQLLISEFTAYFANNSNNPPGRYRTYVIKPGNTPDRVLRLKQLLDRNGIHYGRAKRSGNLTGLDYTTGSSASFAVNEDDLVVSAYQPKAVLVQTLFEPNPTLSDTMTYDITSWALPYAYGLQTYATESRLAVDTSRISNPVPNNTVDGIPLAFFAPWNSVTHARYLSSLLNAGIRVRIAEKAFSHAGREYAAGTLIVARSGNERKTDFQKTVVALANAHGVTLHAASTGYMDSGKDFGSSAVRAIIPPKIAVLSGQSVSSLSLGEVWHHLEQELDYPLSIIDVAWFGSVDLSKYNVLILPSGSYSSIGTAGFEKLEAWISNGGKLIAVESAVDFLSTKDGYGLSSYLTDEEKKAAEKRIAGQAELERLAPYEDRGRQRIANRVAGAVFQVRLDHTHPLGYGTAGTYFTLKNGARRYGYLKNGINVGVILSLPHHRAGFVGANAKPALAESLVFGVQPKGRGQVVYLVDNPLFRGFWEHGKLIMDNAIFMVGQ